MDKAYPQFKLQVWGWENLLEIFRLVTLEDLRSWFGYTPGTLAKTRIGFEEIRVILESIATKKPIPGTPVKDVPPKKIEANQLSDSIKDLLKLGITKSYLITDFFNKWHDPAFGERIAEAFREKYSKIRENRTPNEVFSELQSWIGGTERGKAEHETAVLTVLAYYFESCDIFEEPG